ncbi:MAG: efflux RND transporter periplasmic adaptor subunit [Pseudomonadota bacterium]
MLKRSIQRMLRGMQQVLLAALALTSAHATFAQSEQGAPVSAIVVEQQSIQRVVDLTGTVTAERAARLSVATSGLVSAIYVDAGTQVQADDILLELDPELAQLQFDSARAQMEQANTALKDARRRLQEAQVLVPQQSIAESAVRDLEAEVANDEAALHQATALAAYREGILTRHTLRAPFSGVIAAKRVETGEWIDPGQEVLGLVAIDDVRIDFAVSEDFLSAINPDSTVTFSLNSDPQQIYNGRISAVVPVTDPTARTFLLRVLAKNPGQHMLPGMSVRAALSIEVGRESVVVPRDAIIRFPDGRAVVWVVDSSSGELVAREQPIQVGLSFDGRVEVTSGLESGATVVTRGNEALQGGQRVTIQPATAGR